MVAIVTLSGIKVVQTPLYCMYYISVTKLPLPLPTGILLLRNNYHNVSDISPCTMLWALPTCSSSASYCDMNETPNTLSVNM